MALVTQLSIIQTQAKFVKCVYLRMSVSVCVCVCVCVRGWVARQPCPLEPQQPVRVILVLGLSV